MAVGQKKQNKIEMIHKFSKIWNRSFVEEEPDRALHFIHTHKYCISNFYFFDICSRVI